MVLSAPPPGNTTGVRAAAFGPNSVRPGAPAAQAQERGPPFEAAAQAAIFAPQGNERGCKSIQARFDGKAKACCDYKQLG